MAGAAGLQNRAGLQQQLLQRGLVTKAAYAPGYQVLRPDGHMQPRGKVLQGAEGCVLQLPCCVITLWQGGRDGSVIHVGILNTCLETRGVYGCSCYLSVFLHWSRLLLDVCTNGGAHQSFVQVVITSSLNDQHLLF